MAVESTEAATGCANCAKLREQIARMSVERQKLLELLAAERERSNALFVGYPPQGGMNSDSALSPEWQSLEKPLRYKVADKLNDAVKKALPGAHGVARRAISAFKGMRERE